MRQELRTLPLPAWWNDFLPECWSGWFRVSQAPITVPIGAQGTCAGKPVPSRDDGGRGWVPACDLPPGVEGEGVWKS